MAPVSLIVLYHITELLLDMHQCLRRVLYCRHSSGGAELAIKTNMPLNKNNGVQSAIFPPEM